MSIGCNFRLPFEIYWKSIQLYVPLLKTDEKTANRYRGTVKINHQSGQGQGQLRFLLKTISCNQEGMVIHSSIKPETTKQLDPMQTLQDGKNSHGERPLCTSQGRLSDKHQLKGCLLVSDPGTSSI